MVTLKVTMASIGTGNFFAEKKGDYKTAASDARKLIEKGTWEDKPNYVQYDSPDLSLVFSGTSSNPMTNQFMMIPPKKGYFMCFGDIKE